MEAQLRFPDREFHTIPRLINTRQMDWIILSLISRGFSYPHPNIKLS